jgi:bifunctional DNA-binding transcriptional regulator/antitoxin component of YhaV-PrlF toxin-antitoxin module
MMVGADGQVVIPEHIRLQAGLRPGTHIDWLIQDGKILMVVVATPTDGNRFEHLRGIRKGTMSTDEWLGMTRGDR